MSLETATDETLMAEVRASGCRESFRILYERYRKRMYNFALRMLNDRTLAEDCAQDIFIRLYQKAGHYRTGFKFSSWLYEIARNLVMDQIRKKNVRMAASLDTTDGEAGNPSGSLLDTLSDPQKQPSESASAKEMADIIWDGIRRLEPQDRELIVLCDIQTLPHAEAARILRCRPETLTVRLFRARRKLAKLIGHKEDFLD